ncbi:MAG: hypothetical protein MJ162_01590 [Treponema sp.]|nr:hypothetical protein [Treponema sp.]
MKGNLKQIFLGFTFAAVASVLSAQTADVKSLVNPKYYEELIKNGEVKIIHDAARSNFELAVKNEYEAELNRNIVTKSSDGFPFMYESLFYLSKADLLKSSNSSKDTIEISDVSKVVRSFSKMQGMKYYSTTHKKEKVLYDRAYTINSVSDKKAVSDKTDGSSDGLTLYCLQNDASFGETVYRLNYCESENSLYVVFENQSTMGLSFIKAIEPSNLKIHISVTDCGDYLLLYLATDANCVKFPGMKNKVKDSLNSRMDAVYKWFIRQF